MRKLLSEVRRTIGMVDFAHVAGGANSVGDHRSGLECLERRHLLAPRAAPRLFA